jgi:hypothetical protein
MSKDGMNAKRVGKKKALPAGMCRKGIVKED